MNAWPVSIAPWSGRIFARTEKAPYGFTRPPDS
jgi:hypothetical protein